MGKKRPQRRLKEKKKKETRTVPSLPNLPNEIVLFKILPRLQVKSLRRFSCVSKLWYSTIHDDKHFIAAHSIHAKANSSLLAIFQYLEYRRGSKIWHEEGGELQSKHFIYLNHHNGKVSMAEDYNWSYSDMVATCNGLIYFRSYSEKDRDEVCNPSTQEVLTLPYVSLYEFPFLRFCGFGYDHLKDEYKVVHAYYYNNYKCAVYTLGTSSWRDITFECGLPEDMKIFHTLPPLFVNGAIYWLHYNHDEIFRFDVHLEKFQIISVPISDTCCCDLLCYSFCRGLLEMEGCLCLIHFSYSPTREVEMALYMLKDDKSWVMKKETFILPYSDGTYPFGQLDLLTDRQHILLYYSMDYRSLGFYNAHTRELKELELHRKNKSLPHYVINHVENLQSLKSMVPPDAREEHFMYLTSRSNGMSRLRPRFANMIQRYVIVGSNHPLPTLHFLFLLSSTSLAFPLFWKYKQQWWSFAFFGGILITLTAFFSYVVSCQHPQSDWSVPLMPLPAAVFIFLITTRKKKAFQRFGIWACVVTLFYVLYSVHSTYNIEEIEKRADEGNPNLSSQQVQNKLENQMSV